MRRDGVELGTLVHGLLLISGVLAIWGLAIKNAGSRPGYASAEVLAIIWLFCMCVWFIALVAWGQIEHRLKGRWLPHSMPYALALCVAVIIPSLTLLLNVFRT